MLSRLIVKDDNFNFRLIKERNEKCASKISTKFVSKARSSNYKLHNVLKL